MEASGWQATSQHPSIPYTTVIDRHTRMLIAATNMVPHTVVAVNIPPRPMGYSGRTIADLPNNYIRGICSNKINDCRRSLVADRPKGEVLLKMVRTRKQ